MTSPRVKIKKVSLFLHVEMWRDEMCGLTWLGRIKERKNEENIEEIDNNAFRSIKINCSCNIETVTEIVDLAIKIWGLG